MEPKKKFKPTTYKPMIQSESDIDEGLKRAFSSVRKGSSQESPFKAKPIFGKQSQRAGAPQKPMSWKSRPISKPMSWTPHRETPPTREEPKSEPEAQESEDEAYWSGEKWEEWAYDLYVNYPEFREILPEWFIQAVEEEE